jgi:hypothetical protein
MPSDPHVLIECCTTVRPERHEQEGSMKRTAVATTGAVLISLLGASLASAAPSISAYLSAAVADSARPAEDKQRDADRKPAETLAFAGVKPGDTVIELAQWWAPGARCTR